VNRRHFADALVIGAGPAGSAFANVFAKAGRSVMVVDRGEPGRRVICGGFLGPEMAESAERAGFTAAFGRMPKNPIQNVQVSSPHSGVITTTLNGRAAYAVDRSILGQTLADVARHSGAEYFYRTTMLETRRSAGMWMVTLAGPEGLFEIAARYVVRADGRRPPAPGRNDIFFACRSLYRIPGIPAETVQLHFVRRGHVGLNPLGNEKFILCLHADGRYLKDSKGDLDGMIASLAAQNTALAAVLGKSERIEEWKSCAAEPDSRLIFFENGIFFAGDAVSMIHPVVGGGIPVAIGSGAILAEVLVGRGSDEDPKRLAERYEDVWKDRFASRAHAAAWLGKAERSEAASKVVFSVLGAVPGFLPKIIARTRA
jgi:2-polyprenyl-6-methoxyphenol hydroxylase-like FAD-dependent oxidoreductase